MVDIKIPIHWHCPWCDQLGSVTLEDTEHSPTEPDCVQALKKRARFFCPRFSFCIGMVSALGKDDADALRQLHARLRDATQ